MKTNLLLSSLVFSVFFIACTNQPKTDEKTATGTDSTAAVKSDSAEHSKIIAAKIYIKPDKINEFTDLFRGMTDSTLKEPGCTGYQLYQNPYEKTSFLVFETYVNQAAIDAHFAAPYFKTYGDKIGLLTSKPTEIVIYDVTKK